MIPASDLYYVIFPAYECTHQWLVKVHNFLTFWELVLAFPCFTANLWLHLNFNSPKSAVVHPFFGAILSIYYLLFNYVDTFYVDMAVIGSTYSILLSSYVKSNAYAFCAASTFLTGYWALRECRSVCDVTPEEAFNYFNAVFLYCALQALSSQQAVANLRVKTVQFRGKIIQ